ncbi:MAG: RNA polymerase sigma factor, partial [Planctomycetota bacterium]
MDTPDASILLEQNDFLRRLARGLTRDEAAADDLAQETWLQTLRRPPAEGDPGRGWLATVARNVARNQGRSERRRQDREARVAVHGEATVDERAEQLVSLQGDVAAALGRLSEPLRTAIVLRYYEDRAPAAIAEELGVPVETVRTRLKRGLAKLREDLDRRHGGDRAAWSLPLAGLAEVGARTAVAGTAAGVGWMAVVASLVVAAGAVVVAMIVADPSPGGTGPALDVEVAASSQPAAALGTSMPEETPGGTAEAVADTVQERTPIPPASTEDGAVVRGRVLDTNDAPVANALVELRALPSNQGPTTMESARDAAERLILLEARTSGDGRFEFRVPVESDHVGVLRANHPLHITAAWPLVALSKGADVDVGDAQLVPGGAVRVRLTNGEGEPLAESSWSVRADSNAQVPGRPRSGYSATAEVDAATGIALVDGLPVGPVEIAVSSPLFKGRIEGRAEVVLGEEVALDLAHDGPSAATRLAVEFRGRMVAAQPASETVRLDATDGPRAPVEHRGFGPFLFTDLEPGSYRVESTDPRFRPWSAVLETGRVHRVELIGAASARFVVRDAKTG